MGSDAAAGARAGASRWRWLPVCGLLLALSTVWMFAGERDFFYGHLLHAQNTAKNMILARNLSAGFLGFQFLRKRRAADGSVSYVPYNRFPIGVFVLTKLVIAPFAGDAAAQIAAARALMLAFFCAAALFAYFSLARLVGRAVALGATLLAFSSYHLLHYSDTVSNEMSPDLFAVMLVFHGLVLFEIDGGRRRFWELAARVCVALLIGWHVYGLLLPYLAFVAVREGWAAGRRVGSGTGRERRVGSGTGRERRVGSGTVGGTDMLTKRVGAAVAAVVRGRAVLLGALALLFGAGVLGWNFAQEYTAFDGRRPVAELPSVRSMFRRAGLREEAGTHVWPAALRWHFHRVGAACLPFALTAGADFDEFAWRESEGFWLFWTGVIATFAALAGVAVLRGPRAPPAALVLAGFGWTLLVPETLKWPAHQYETIFHVGVPLWLFVALLLGANRFWRPAPAVAAAAAAVVFAASSIGLGLRQGHAGAARAERAQMAEFEAVAKKVRGGNVWVATPKDTFDRFVDQRRFVDFYLAGGFVRYASRSDVLDTKAIRAADFVLAFERYETPALLTPEHQSVFLYRAGAAAGAVWAAMQEARREEHSRLSARTLVARAGWDLHVVRGEGGRTELVYFKSPCAVDDTQGLLHLRFAPVGGKVPWGRARHLEHRSFFFHEVGAMVDDKCVMRVPLPPDWPVAAAHTGQTYPAGGAASWRAVFQLDVDRLRDAFRALHGETPAARGEFDMYLRHGVLHYARRPCAPAEVRRRFFLHVVPETLRALPRARRRSGLDNLDFDFGEHGAVFDGACVAMVTLPDYDIVRIHTGQIDDAGVVAWRIDFAPNQATAFAEESRTAESHAK